MSNTQQINKEDKNLVSTLTVHATQHVILPLNTFPWNDFIIDNGKSFHTSATHEHRTQNHRYLDIYTIY